MCVCVYACVGVLLCEHIMCGYYACGRQRSLSSITFICLSVSEAGSLSEPRAHGLIRLVYFHALRTCLSNQPHTWLGIWLLQIWAQIILTVLKFFFSPTYFLWQTLLMHQSLSWVCFVAHIDFEIIMITY